MTFDEFLRQVCPPLQLNWRKYRRRAARHRVQGRMRELDLPDYPSYLERLQSDRAEAEELADRMRVTVTRFFREGDRWQFLAESLLPNLLESRKPGTLLRAWSAGCAGGEEPCSLAALWLAEIALRYPSHSLQILATDIDGASLERARRGSIPQARCGKFPRRSGTVSSSA